MRQPERLLDTSYSDQSICLGVSIGVHILLLLWNPILLKGHVQAPHNPLVSIDMIVDAPSTGGATAEEAPKKMSIMDTLKTMLMTPKVDQIAHINTQPPATRVAAPLLQDRTTPRPAMQFQPKSQTQDLASMSANQIDVKGPNMELKPNQPTLTAKTFGGIRTKELPFQTGTDQGITGGPSVPIAVGNRSAKEALNYTSPTLSEKGTPRMGIQTPRSTLGNVSTVGTGGPSTIALSGTGGSGNAPTGATSGAVLTERAGTPGFGRPGTGGMGGGRGNSIGSGVEGVPSAAADLDRQISDGSNRAKKPKSVELEGPIGNRTILRKVIPQYPAWAEEQGIIGSVRIYFTVAADGTVRSNLRVTKTTGYPQLDQLGLDALKQWRFAPAPASTDEGSQWGIITFNFSLSS